MKGGVAGENLFQKYKNQRKSEEGEKRRGRERWKVHCQPSYPTGVKGASVKVKKKSGVTEFKRKKKADRKNVRQKSDRWKEGKTTSGDRRVLARLKLQGKLVFPGGAGGRVLRKGI